jgi:acyl dehydratase
MRPEPTCLKRSLKSARTIHLLWPQGFDRPILHGLCSYGFTGRSLLHTLCGGESSRFHQIEARFASPVLPGEALTVSMLEVGNGEAMTAS